MITHKPNEFVVGGLLVSGVVSQIWFFFFFLIIKKQLVMEIPFKFF